MEEYEKIGRVFARVYNLQKVLELLDFEIRLHPDSAEARLDQVIVLKEIIHDVVTSDELLLLIEKVKAKSKDLNDWQKVNFGFIDDFCNKRRSVPFELVESFTRVGFFCRSAYMEAKKAKDFALVKEEFSKLIEVLREIGDIFAKGLEIDRYSALLKANQIDPENLEKLCIGVSPFLKGKVQNVGEKPLTPQTQEVKGIKHIYKRVVEKFFPKNTVKVFFSDHSHLFGEKNDLRLLIQEGEEAQLPALLFLLGQGLYITNLPHSKWNAQPICNPASIAMHAAQGFLFSHFLLEEKVFAQSLGGYEKTQYSNSIMCANKFVALTHLMIRFSIEKSLLNGEVNIDDLQKLFIEDLSYYFNVDDPSISILDNHHWFFGEFCYYPAYLKGMIAAGQIFHILKSEGHGMKDGKPLIRKLIAWLSSNVYTKGARYSMDELITKLTGEALDCRFFKKFN